MDMSVGEDITAVSIKTRESVVSIMHMLLLLMFVITTGKTVGTGVTMTEQIAKQFTSRNVRSQAFAHRQDTR